MMAIKNIMRVTAVAIVSIGLFPTFAFAVQDPNPTFGAERQAKTQQQKLEPDQLDGSFNYQYPLTLPLGRNGLAPNLSLQYSSKNTEQISPFGYGWAISIPYIERMNRYGVNKLYTSPIFFSSLDGELAATSTGGMGGLGISMEDLLFGTESTDTATSSPATSTTPISGSLAGKTPEEKANIKAEEIYKLDLYGSYTDNTYGVTVEIVDYEKIDGGIQVFARGWKGDRQLGFGTDGSVDIERFRIFNPPILASDGTKRTVIDQVGDRQIEMQVDNYKEDPKAAVQQSLAHIIQLVGKENAAIVKGKFGNTISTFFPNTAEDGDVARNPASAQAWPAIRSGSGTEANSAVAQRALIYMYPAHATNDSWWALHRGIFMFNTSNIPDTDTISSATLSLYGSAKSDGMSVTPNVSVYGVTTGSDTSISASDYDIANWGTTEFASSTSYSSWSTTGYNDFALNATGVATINVSGRTKFGLRNVNYDVANVAPTHSVVSDSYLSTNYADQSGTSQDPKLVVVHTGSGGGTGEPGTYEYGALVENGNFNAYEFENDARWRMTDKMGTIFTFGSTTSARIDNAASSTQIYRWLLQEVRDRNNNYISYSYYKDGNQAYPHRITYTGNGSTDGVYEIEFIRESRSDTATSSVAGFPVGTLYRISEIQIKVNGLLQHKYELDYGIGSNGVRSMLTSIIETGYDENSNATALPASTFKYTTKTGSWVQSSSWAVPLPVVDDISPYGEIDMGLRFEDFNGDGWQDIMQGRDGTKNLYLNNRNGTWATTTPSGLQDFVTVGGEDMGTRPVDLDGDGLIDLLANNTYGYMNGGRGTSFSGDTTWGSPIKFQKATDGEHYDMGSRVADINGDGLPDLLKAYEPGSSNAAVGIYLNNGAGWDATTTNAWYMPSSEYFAHIWSPNEGIDMGGRFGDFNGDGLTDLIFSRGGGNPPYTRIYINQGDGTWERVVPTGFSGLIVEQEGGDNYIFPVDANGDGLTDLFDAVNSTVYINQNAGKSFSGGGWTNPVSFKCTSSCNGAVDLGARLVDINADGIVDIVKNYAGAATSPGMNGVFLGSGSVPDLLTMVVSSKGATTTALYTASTQYTSSGSSTNPILPLVLQTVSDVGLTDGFGTVGTTTYSYGGGSFYYVSEYDRKFGGFATSTVTDEMGNVTKTYFHQGNGTQSSIGEYSDSKAKIGKPYRTEIYDNSSNLFAKLIDKWDSASLSSGRTFLKKVRSTEFTYDGDSDHKDKATTFSYDDTIGNLSEKIEYGEVTGGDDGSFTDTGTDKRTKTYSYATSSANYIYGLPQKETVTNNSGSRVAERRFYYDSLSLGSVDKGNLTKRENWITGSTYASTTRAYNSYGLVTSESDPIGNTTSYSYESGNMYVGTTTNALSQVTETYRDMTNGKVKKLVDPNGLSFETVFDGLDRVTSEKVPDHLGTPTNTVTRNTYTYTDSVGTRKIVRSDYLNAATSTDTYTYLDSFDRPIQIRREMEGSDYSVRDFQYDERGDVRKQSLPYTSTGSARQSITSDSNLLVRFGYDALRRATSTIDAVGTETYSYDQWVKTVTDKRGKTKDFTSDAFGNLLQVDERNGGSTYSTVYIYDALGNLTKITDAASNLRNFAYDGLSRLTSAEDLHASGDANYGTRTYTYDAGNLTSMTDAKSQTKELTYDALNRVLTENYTGAAGTEISYGYDTCTYGKGRICAATTTDAVTNIAYDALGNASSESRTIDGSTYTTTFARDRLNNLTSIVYPNSREVRYGYNAAGQLEEITSKPSGGTFSTIIIEDFDYGPTGQTTYKRFGNLVESTYTYDNTQLYRLTNISTNIVPVGGMMDDVFLEELPADPVALLELRVASSTGLVLRETIENTSSDIGSSTPEIPAVEEITAPDEIPAPLQDIPMPEIVEETASFTLPDFASSTPATSTPMVELSILEIPSPTLPDDTASTSDALLETALATSTDASATSSIAALLEGKTKEGRADIKSGEIVKRNPVGEYMDEKYGNRIQIESIEKIDGGIQVFAKAWSGDQQLGFSSDGTVETERFRIFNPPILVADGTKRTIKEKVGPNEIELEVDNFKEDPVAALQQALAHTISIVGRVGADIAAGSVGNTTDTYYPDGNPESTSVDGDVGRGPGSPESWSTIRSASSGTTGDAHDSNTSRVAIYIYTPNTSGDAWGALHRSFYLFDTSAITDSDTISSATVSLYGSGKSDSLSITPNINIYSSTPASNTSLVEEDYDQVGTTAFSTAVTYSGWSTTGYNDFAFNSDGLAAVNAVGISKFSARNANYDVSGTVPTHSVSGDSYVSTYYADQAGTTQDPKLVVVHSAAATSSPSGTMQNISYTYDAGSNITQITDYSGTTGKIVSFGYDDLNRLTSASSTAASSTPFKQTYAYDSLGNITGWKNDSSATTTYTYAGTLYANPHAATAIGSTTRGYDENGNATSSGAFAFTWDYRDRLTQVATGTATTTHGYDHNNQRVWKKTSSSATTTYPNMYYSVTSGASSTAYIYAGDTLVAFVETGTTTANTFYVHTDHLGSTHVTTNASGTITQSQDYYPFGSTRVDTDTTNTDLKKQFIGQYFDDSSSLSYLQARYYDAARGQFVSQDPVFLGEPREMNLANPQSLNSYSYALNNPISNKDPNGEQAVEAATLATIIVALAAIAATLAAIQAAGGGNSEAFAHAVSGVDRALTSVGNILKTSVITVGSAIILSPTATIYTASPIIGGTAATTPYAITPNGTTLPWAQGQDISGISLSSSGKTTITEKAGGYPQAKRDFDALNPTNVTTQPNGTITGKLPTGEKVNVRPHSSDGRPTLEIQKPSGEIQKTRYNE